jgi:hypothetical protein
MANKVTKGICLLLLWLTATSCLPQPAQADEDPTGIVGSPVIYLAAGALAVNVGATIANGFALVAGKPNRGNGMFGVVLGSATVAAGVVGLAASNGDTNSERFSIVLASCGLASLLTGYFNIRGAGHRDEIRQGIGGGDANLRGVGDGAADRAAPRLIIGPYVAGRDHGWVAAVQMGF